MSDWRRELFSVFLDCIPTPKGRPKFTRGKNGFAQAYTPKATQEGEEDVAQEMSRSGIKVIEDPNIPLSVYLVVFIRRPGKPRAVVPITKPDLDNYQKLVLDAMNQKVFPDDSQIVHSEGWKVYSPNGRTGYGLRVWEILQAPDIYPEDFE